MIFRDIVYFILLYSILAYNVLYQTYDGFILLVFFVSASFLSLLMLILCRITIKRYFEEKTIYVTRQQEYTVRYHIKNVMPFPITRAGILFDGFKKPQTFTVGAAGTAIVTKKDVKEHCGCYFTGIEKIFLYDFFCLSRFCIKNPGVVKIVSLPRLFDINTKEYIEGMLHENTDDKTAVHGSEISGIRQYRDGDSLKNIHHKLSGRMSELMVKEYTAEDEDEDGFFFYIDGNADAQITDAMLEFMYNAMYLKLAQGRAVVGYILENKKAVPVRIASKSMLDEFFGRMYEENRCDGKYCPDIPYGTYVFAAALTEPLYNICSGLNGRKKHLVLYLPESEGIQWTNLDAEVVYVSTGGEEN